MLRKLNLKQVLLQEKDGVKPPSLTVRFECVHQNESTTLRLPVTFCRQHDGWNANIDLEALQQLPTIGEAKNKLAEWLHRAAEAIAESDVDVIDLNTIDLDGC